MDDVAGLVVWDIDGTLIPADLRWLRRSIARTYGLADDAVTFPAQRVHGYTDESIVIDAAICSGIEASAAEAGIQRFQGVLAEVMIAGRSELARDQPAYPGAAASIESLHRNGFIQTVLTGNLRPAAEVKLAVTGLADHLDLGIGGFGSDARDRFALPAVIAQRFAGRYGRPLESERTIVIGDTPNDIACARHAGFRVVVVSHRADIAELAQYRPDAIMEGLDPSKLVDVVNMLIHPPSTEASSQPS